MVFHARGRKRGRLVILAMLVEVSSHGSSVVVRSRLAGIASVGGLFENLKTEMLPTLFRFAQLWRTWKTETLIA